MNTQEERSRRWRLILGGDEQEEIGAFLRGEDLAIDRALGTLYDSDRAGGLGSSMPNVSRWLGDIRTYFPKSVVQILQRDAVERLDLKRLLLEKELLESVEPDVHLVGTLLSLSGVLPEKTKETARQVVRKIVQELEKRLAQPLRQAVLGSLHRASSTRRPRHNEINWRKTIEKNLKHYQPEYQTIVPETLIGYGRRSSSLKHIVLLVDQSGSMSSSVVYSGIMAAVLASIRAVKTSMVVFDTSVVDLTDLLHDPVEVLFATRLGGGTDIERALRYSEGLVTNPRDTILVLISDLFEGGNVTEMFKCAHSLVQSGVQVITLLALDDEGAPAYDHRNATTFAGLGIPTFACTPDLFPELMAATIKREDVTLWASSRGIVAAKEF